MKQSELNEGFLSVLQFGLLCAPIIKFTWVSTTLVCNFAIDQMRGDGLSVQVRDTSLTAEQGT